MARATPRGASRPGLWPTTSRGATGAISERRTLVHIDQPGVAPDGLTVDEDGAIWVALWGGAAVNRYAPDRSLLATVPVPVARPTSCAFGGPDRATPARPNCRRVAGRKPLRWRAR